MCGIAGFFDRCGELTDSRELLRAMSDRLAHRGPDDSGLWWDDQAHIGFAHRRLSIIDLSPMGHQPMVSASGRFTIVFNGEIYNASDVRAELDTRSSHAWRGRSDTEVMLAAFEQWGVTEATKRFDGMFALALYDRDEARLHLVRDRVGKKPLYYGWIGGVFAFASELKALKIVSRGQLSLDPTAVAAMLRRGYVPGASCIYQGLSKLQAGTIATLCVGENAPLRAAPSMEQYWSAATVAERGCDNTLTHSPRTLVDQMDAHLERAVRARMISDVPLGAFLSGGIDSALVVAMMARVSPTPIETFTIGFEDARFDESDAALETSRALRTNHTCLRITSTHAMAIIPSLCERYDEPFADSSQIPTAMLSSLARSRVTVALSGDGGDEVFGGYDRYRYTPRLVRAMGLIPSAIHPLLSQALRSQLLPDKCARIASILDSSSLDGAYRMLARTSDRCEGLVIGTKIADRASEESLWSSGVTHPASQMMQRDLVSYLVDDILVKVDRASMSVGLEVRSPMLDHHLIEWAWRLPISLKVGRGQGKVISRQLAARIIPEGARRRSKMGFAAPIAQWLRADLRDWAESLLSRDRLARDGVLNPEPIRSIWEDFLTGRESDRHLIWAILMFQSWLASQSRPQGPSNGGEPSSSNAAQ
ncbi:MAG: asparagine synthase (glutamine-hydrolyzing) [Phycisphaerales bacterium]|nr:asparagine synthase (glutamine-hydrolyzing) [Phycisphaerales bacterium]